MQKNNERMRIFVLFCIGYAFMSYWHGINWHGLFPNDKTEKNTKADSRPRVGDTNVRIKNASAKDPAQAKVMSVSLPRNFNLSDLTGMEEINNIEGLPEMLYYWSGEENPEMLIRTIHKYAVEQGINPMAYFYGGMVESKWKADCSTQKTQDGTEPFAYGVYQATPENRHVMNTDVNEMKAMSASQQIELFRALDNHKFSYLVNQGKIQSKRDRLKNPIDYITYRLVVMQPAVLDEYQRGEWEYIVFKPNSNALDRNPGCDIDNNKTVNLIEFINFHKQAKVSSLREIPLYTMFGKIKHWKKGVTGIIVYQNELDAFMKWISHKINNKQSKLPSEYVDYYYSVKKLNNPRSG